MKVQGDPINLIICGIGGQGNILLSRIIGRILTRKGYKVNIGETFGAAQRGGAVYSSVRISKKNNYGPLVPEGHGHVILSLEPLEALRSLCTFGNPEVITLTNTAPIYPVGVLSKRLEYPNPEKTIETIRKLSKKSWFVNATEMAAELESPIAANMIMLGALIGSRTIPVTTEDAEEEVRRTFPTPKLDLNLEALHRGLEAIAQ